MTRLLCSLLLLLQEINLIAMSFPRLSHVFPSGEPRTMDHMQHRLETAPRSVYTHLTRPIRRTSLLLVCILLALCSRRTAAAPLPPAVLHVTLRWLWEQAMRKLAGWTSLTALSLANLDCCLDWGLMRTLSSLTSLQVAVCGG